MLNSKKVIQICLSPSWGGLEMVTYEFARDFQKRQVSLLTICLKNSPLAKKLDECGLPSLPIPHREIWSRMKFLHQALETENPDSVICQHLHDLWFLMPLIYFKKMRAIGLSHTFLGVSKKDFLHTLLYRRLDRMICLTQLHKLNLLSHLNMPEAKLAIIPNMVDIARFAPEQRSDVLYNRYDIPKNKILVGIVGRLDEHKGQREALLAIEELKKYSSRIHLLVIGEDTLNNPGTGLLLQKLVRERGLENMVTFTGYVEQIEKVIASLDILLVPSRAETFGRTIIEGMASGVPVISTRAGGVPDIISDRQTGLLVEPNNAKELAFAIEKLVLNPELRHQLQEAALKKARSLYAREVVERQLTSIIVAS